MALPLGLHSYNFTISPPQPNQCILNYFIKPTDGRGVVLNNITVEVTERESPVTVTSSGFDLCNNNYTFTVVAWTAAGPGDTSVGVNSEPVNLGEYSCTWP
jgi:hypothetical protein